MALRTDAPEEGTEGDMARLPARGQAEEPTFVTVEPVSIEMPVERFPRHFVSDTAPMFVTGTLQDLFGKPEWPPSYPHVPGVPCKDCGWDGVVKDAD